MKLQGSTLHWEPYPQGSYTLPLAFQSLLFPPASYQASPSFFYSIPWARVGKWIEAKRESPKF